MLQLPQKISEYIKGRFRDGFLIEVTTAKDENGQVILKVDVNENDVLHHLHFTETGKLISADTESLFSEDNFE